MATADYTNRRILLASRPTGAPTPENFRIEDTPAQKPSEGEVLLKILYLSLDPYMRGRMSAARSISVGAASRRGRLRCASGACSQTHGTEHLHCRRIGRAVSDRDRR